MITPAVERDRAYAMIRTLVEWAIQPDNGYWRCMLCSPREFGAHNRAEVVHRGGCPFVHREHAAVLAEAQKMRCSYE